MLVPGSASPLLFHAPAGGAATAGRSVRFNSADSAYLSRTPASAGNRRIFTVSFWIKRTDLNSYVTIFGAGTDTDYLTVRFNLQGAGRTNDELEISTLNFAIYTSALFRDVSAWYHFVIAFDTTQTTASDRVKIYVNNSLLTAFRSASYPTQNSDLPWNNAVAQNIGRLPAFGGIHYLSGSLANFYNIDGQALTPSSFGETSATTGRWEAKTYAGSYGTNGFFLNFSDNSGATSTTLGKDAAGSNNWTPNNLSVTAGSGNDSLRDHPVSAGTSTGLGGEVSGNYCTLNPLANPSGATLSNGNLDWSSTAAQNGACAGTIYVSSGKWYWEVTDNSGANALYIGITKSDDNLAASPGTTPGGYYYIDIGSAYTYNNNNLVSYGSTWASGDVIGVALNMDAGTLVFYKNGVSQGTAFTGLSGAFAPSFGDGGSSTAAAATLNAGQRAFAYTAPSGFSPLVDTLLPTPTIALPNTVMDVVTYTGNGSARSITGYNFSPDFVWIKKRNTATNGDHELFDTVRGTGKYLNSNATSAEGTDNQTLTAFNSDGFSLGTNSFVNFNGNTFVGWAWDAGSSNATNTSGTITSTVRANISAGFSIITLTTPASTGSYSVGHGLGIKPAFTIWKSRTTAGNYWFCQHQGLGNMVDYYIRLESTAAGAYSAGRWVNEPTSSLLYTNVGNTWNTSDNIVCYAWAPVAGYSAFGSYTGNGSATDGPFVFCNFRPRWVLIKITSSTGDWIVWDTARNTANAMAKLLFPNSSSSELDNSSYDIDCLSNGFKIRSNGGSYNTSSATYVWAAFAENPFAYARAR